MDRATDSGAVRDGAGIAGGVLLILMGFTFLAGQYFRFDIGHFAWPFFVILPGLAFFVAMLAGGRPAGPLAVPGSVITTVGLILLYQNTTGHWESWSYAWALIPTAVGAGLMINGAWSENPVIQQNGKRVAFIGLVLFALFGTFFELALNLGGFLFVRQWFWPLVLIGLGAYLILRKGTRAAGR